MSEEPRESNVPRSVAERAADLAMTVAGQSLEDDGAELVTMIVLIHAKGVPEGELDCVSAGHGYDDGRELLADVFGHFAGAAKALGLEVKLAPLRRG